MQSDLDNIEYEINEMKKYISLGDKVEKLHKNPEFIELISKGYLTNKALELLDAKGSPNLNLDAEKVVDKQIYGISGFKAYINEIMYKCEEARDKLAINERERDKLLAEDAKGDL